MDCLICFKIFIKEAEYEYISPPKSEICARSICKLLKIPNSPRIEKIFQDPVICSKCYQILEDVNQKFVQLEDLQSKIEEIRGQVIKDLKNSKNTSQIMQNVYGGVSTISSLRREQLFEEASSDENLEPSLNIPIRIKRSRAKRANNSIKNNGFQESSKLKESASQFEMNLEKRIPKKRRLQIRKNWPKITPKSSKNSQISGMICKEIFPSISTSSNQQNHSERPKKCLICSECEKPHNSKSELETHMENALNSSKIQKCSKCAEEYWGSQCLEYHIEKHHTRDQEMNDNFEQTHNQSNSRNWKCSVCGLKFNFKFRLNRHQLIHGPKKFKCPFKECGMKFHRDDYLRKHKKVHYTKREGINKKLGKVEKDPRKQRVTHKVTHRVTHKNKTEGKKYQCQFCSRKFLLESQIRNHLREEKPSECTICNENFKSVGCLNHHNSVVHGKGYRGQKNRTQAQFQCNICNKFYSTVSSLNVHKARHGGPKFSCPEKDCKRRFMSKNNMSYHIRVKHKKF